MAKINSLIKPLSPLRIKENYGRFTTSRRLDRKVSRPKLLIFPNAALDFPANVPRYTHNDAIKQDSEEVVCAFCEESLCAFLPGEISLQLTCSHVCHKECYLVMLNSAHLSRTVRCEICDEDVKCDDDAINSEIFRDKLMATSIVTSAELTSTADDVTSTSDDKSSFISLNSDSDSVMRQFIDPKVHITKNRLNATDCSCYEFECLLTIRQPPIVERSKESPGDTTLRRSIVDVVKELLFDRVTNLDICPVALGNENNLLVFDYFDISTNGIDWDPICGFLFETILLLVNKDDFTLVGQILTRCDICKVNVERGNISLHMKNEWLPELLIRHQTIFATSRWGYYLEQAMKPHAVNEGTLLQLTMNAWNLIPEELRPKESSLFMEFSKGDMNMSPSSLIKCMPPLREIPLNLIISVPVISSTHFNSEEHKQLLVTFLQLIKTNLRPIDKLGLIFVGVDGTGNPSEKGSFISCIEPLWNGWDDLINDLKIFQNKSKHGQAIFRCETDEVIVGLEKCQSLMRFQQPDSSSKYELVLLCYNNYQDISVSLVKQDKARTLIHHLQDKFKVKLNFIRIGNGYSSELESIYNSTFTVSSQNNEIKVNFGNKIHRFSSLENFNENVKEFIEMRFHTPSIPTISVEFMASDFNPVKTDLLEIEINGEVSQVDNSFKCFTISALNVLPCRERNILMKFKLHPPFLGKGNLQMYPILNYKVSWLDKNDDTRLLTANLAEKRLSSSYVLFSNSSSKEVTSPLDQVDKDSYFVDIPLVPAIATSKEQVFMKRKTELAVIKILRAMNDSPSQSENLIECLITQIFGMLRGIVRDTEQNDYEGLMTDYSGSSLRYEKLACKSFQTNLQYIQFLVAELEDISKIFRKDSSLALVRCKDFVNSIV